MCSRDHWCWENPLPQGNDLTTAWAPGPDNFWTAGNAGTVLRYDHRGWQALRLPEEAGNANAIWASGPDDAWVIATNTLSQTRVFHWNGTQWSLPVLGAAPSDFTPSDIWGTAPDDVWLAGSGRPVLHYDGHDWSVRYNRSFPAIRTHIAGTGRDDVWFLATGNPDAALEHWNGASFESIAPPAGQPWIEFRTLWAADPRSVWVESQRQLFRSTGSDWAEVPFPVSPQYGLTGGWGAASTDVWITASTSLAYNPPPDLLGRWNGTAWSLEASPIAGTIRDIAGSAANDVWIVGEAGGVGHRDDHRWSSIFPRNFVTGQPVEFTSVWGSGPNDIWAVGNVQLSLGERGRIFHSDGSTWSEVPHTINAHLSSLWGSGPNDVWCVGSRGTVLHWNGTTWSRVDSRTDASVNDVWGSAANDVWASMDSDQLLHWDGSSWRPVPISLPTDHPYLRVWRVQGSSAHDVWALGSWVEGMSDREGVFHYDGSAWSVGPQSPGCGLVGQHGLQVNAGNDVWIVGNMVACHWDGAAYTRYDLPLPPVYPPQGVSWSGYEGETSVWASGPDNLWAANGRLMHWDGRAWSRIDDAGGSPQAIWGADPHNIVAAGRGSHVLRYRH